MSYELALLITGAVCALGAQILGHIVGHEFRAWRIRRRYEIRRRVGRSVLFRP